MRQPSVLLNEVNGCWKKHGLHISYRNNHPVQSREANLSA
jgi:hypothetical protein